MKPFILSILLLFSSSLLWSQDNEKVSVMDFVQVLNDNKAEALYYYQNNWQLLREMALKKGYIESYQLLETPASEEQPFHFVLITTFKNKEQYDLVEKHFEELIKEKGPLRLLNEKKPGEFRKNLFFKDGVKHLN